MKRLLAAFGFLAVLFLCSAGKASAYDFDGAAMVPSISNSIINDGGAQAYANTISGSEIGILSGAADNTDSITWSFTLPAGQWIKGVRVRYEPTIAALDAAPDCTLYQQRFSNRGMGTTLTSTTLTLTEDPTSCVVTKDLPRLCTATLGSAVTTQRGDIYSVACLFNKAAAGKVYITRVGIYAQGN